MSNKNLFYATWKNYLSTKKLEEATDASMRAIQDALKLVEEHPEQLPFQKMFGPTDIRIVKPMEQKNVTKVIALMKFISQNLAVVDPNNPSYYNYKQVSYEVKQDTVMVKERPLGWVEGDPTREVPKKISSILVVIPYYTVNPNTNESTLKFKNTTIPGALSEASKAITKRLNKRISELDPNTYYYKDEKTAHLQILEAETKRAKEMREWWQQNQARLIKDPELLKLAVERFPSTKIGAADFYGLEDEELGEVNNEYSIIFSRSPVDVMRMSDFPDTGITSCHSERGGSFYACAVAEAQNVGGIAFLVKTEDLDTIDDINSVEIYRDPQRGIQGIYPIDRIRLRNVTIGRTTSVAVPEKQQYSSSPVDGFKFSVDQFAAETQASMFVSEEGGQKKIKLPSENRNDYVRHGGKYADNRVEDLFQDLILNIAKTENITLSEEEKTKISSVASNNHMTVVSRENAYAYLVEDDDEQEDDEEQVAREESEETFVRAQGNVNRNSYFTSQFDFEWEWGDGATIDGHFSYPFSFPRNTFSSVFFDLDKDELQSQIKEMIQNDYGSGSDFDRLPLEVSDVYVGRDEDLILIEIFMSQRLHDSDEFADRARAFVAMARNLQEKDFVVSFLNILESDGGTLLKANFDKEETPVSKFDNLNKWVENKSDNFKFVNREGILYYYLVRNKISGKAISAETNRFLITKLPKKFTDYNNAVMFGHEITSVLKRHEFKTRIAALSNPKGIDAGNPSHSYSAQTQFSFGKQDRLYDYDFEIEVVPEYKEYVESLGGFQDKSDKSTWVYAMICITVRYSPTLNIQKLTNLIDNIDEDPNKLLEIVYEATRIAVNKRMELLSQDIPVDSEMRGFTTRGEAEAEKNVEKQSLTESQKKIIRERLIKLLKNKKARR